MSGARFILTQARSGTGGGSGRLIGNLRHAEPSEIPYRNTATMAADALRHSAYAATELKETEEDTSPRQSANTLQLPQAPPLHTRFKKAQSGNPRGRPKKDLPGLLVAALNEPVYVTTNGKRRKITKCEVIVTQMVNESAGADLRATKMPKDIEKKTSAEPPPELHRYAPADEEVIYGVRQRIRGALLQEIKDMNAGNPALAMISLPLS